MKDFQRAIRRMGYLRDQDGIMNRYFREKSGWDLHLKKTREFINGAFAGKTPGSIAVLGSGWLLDVPLEEMIQRYDHIYLVDIHHPPQVRKRTGGFSKVDLIEADLTGGAIGQLWQIVKMRKKLTEDDLLREIKLVPPLVQIHPDALISVNLLNQLDIILYEYLERKEHLRQAPANRFRSMIQSFHLSWITRGPGCLITDAVEKNHDRYGVVTEKPLLFTDLPVGIRTAHWNWEFDSRGSYRPGSVTTMEVQAVEWT